ncbi:MAG: hypothetical protein LBQ73_09690 [Tannerellaceae bacterium]|jgi:hypothetical protein|nr:hypothetical protein [Tannerellaceae bacterium]
MHTRLNEIIQYKTGGQRTEFASLMDWSPQYLSKLLKGEGFGLQPVLAIVTKVKEVNARWLLTGEGAMVDNKKYTDIRKTMHETMIKVLDMEKYMPVMTSGELREFEQIVAGKKKVDFRPDTVERWAQLLRDREDKLSAKFKAAGRKSNELCKQKKGKKQ